MWSNPYELRIRLLSKNRESTPKREQSGILVGSTVLLTGGEGSEKGWEGDWTRGKGPERRRGGVQTGGRSLGVRIGTYTGLGLEVPGLNPRIGPGEEDGTWGPEFHGFKTSSSR